MADAPTPVPGPRPPDTVLRDAANLVDALGRAEIGAWVLDLTTLHAWISPHATTLLEAAATDDDWSLQRLLGVVIPDDRQGVAESLGSAAASGGEWRAEFRILAREGEERWIRIDGGPGSASTGPSLMMGIVQDVTERRRVADALRLAVAESRSKAAELQAVLDAVPAAVWIARDPRGDRIEANRFGAEILRRSPGENVSLTAPGTTRLPGVRVLVDGREATRADLPIQVAAGGTEVRDVEAQLQFDDGEVRTIFGSAVPLRDGDGRLAGSVGAFVDTTDRNRAERASREASRLRDLVAHADAAREQEKKRIASELHDEMGQLLSALRYNVEGLETVLQAQPPGGLVDRLLPRVRESVTLVSQAAAALQRVVTGLRPAALDVLGICAALLELGRRFGARSEARCSVIVPDRVNGFGTDVDTVLFRVAQEALTNVARHADARTVTVSLEQDEGHVVLRVEDDGRGLPPDVEIETSFGLASMRERVERLGGSLRLSGGPTGGTTVEARIPAQFTA